MALYLNQLARANQAGARIQGYFTWSLMDLNEWAMGYDYPMGLLYVDHATQKRIQKDSARWYAAFIARAVDRPT